MATNITTTQAIDTTSPAISITVGCGNDKKTFFIHQSILTSHSDYFKTACKPEWKGADRALELPNDDVTAFEQFAHFAYCNRLLSVPSGATLQTVGNDNMSGRAAFIVQADLYRECWPLGDKLLATDFKDASLDCMVDLTRRTKRVPLKAHEVVYARTAGPCTLRRLIVDIAVFGWNKSVLAACQTDSAWMDFFKDIAVRCAEAGADVGTSRPYLADDCTYHEHGEKPCYKTRV